ncbi:MAG: Transcriptional regulator, ArsR family [Candidatus Nomurabacteria bacterium GW2011_GWB1_37_5]|uniref:Transcriptional regulator, ArsR family n=1 Tax=Candidatus Nomurabacteria bacterium GW2011_GWB1_37_5 TaxID=1618742 RepID=A0A0G0GU03_9BACT|nr:MAG: Transcriptional regulator, ArsR family [Candidatus Nomurabacteria bacterium GW2011_GWB1_37_5]
MKQLEKNLKALANKRRLEILKYLKHNLTSNVGELSKQLGFSYKATSKHLAILRAQDIVEKEQVGFNVVYEISPKLSSEVAFIIKLL